MQNVSSQDAGDSALIPSRILRVNKCHSVLCELLAHLEMLRGESVCEPPCKQDKNTLTFWDIYHNVTKKISCVFICLFSQAKKNFRLFKMSFVQLNTFYCIE